MVLNVVMPVYRCFVDGANKRQLVVGCYQLEALLEAAYLLYYQPEEECKK